MRDVAARAGVSIATVSAVLNGSVPVSPKRKQRVLEAMAALSYSPDQVARSLKTGRSRVLGVIVPDITNPFFPEVVGHIEEAAGRRGYAVILGNSAENSDRERDLVGILHSRRVDGIIVATAGAHGGEVKPAPRCPIVYFDRVPNNGAFSSVCTDHEDSACRATQHLIALGHRRVGVITGNLNASSHSLRLAGFRKALDGFALPLPAEYVRTGSMGVESGYRLALEMLRLPSRPTAILATNNRMLLGLTRAAAELQISIPKELSVVGFDNSAWTENFHPRLTTVAQATRQIGEETVRLILDQINEPGAHPMEHIKVRAEILLRESTAPALPYEDMLAAAARSAATHKER